MFTWLTETSTSATGRGLQSATDGFWICSMWGFDTKHKMPKLWKKKKPSQISNCECIWLKVPCSFKIKARLITFLHSFFFFSNQKVYLHKGIIIHRSWEKTTHVHRDPNTQTLKISVNSENTCTDHCEERSPEQRAPLVYIYIYIYLAIITVKPGWSDGALMD